MARKDIIIRGKSGDEVLSIDLEEYLSSDYPYSVPPVGACKIINIYFNPTTGKIVCEYDDTPAT